jgi:hypothetical protein
LMMWMEPGFTPPPSRCWTNTSVFVLRYSTPPATVAFRSLISRSMAGLSGVPKWLLLVTL